MRYRIETYRSYEYEEDCVKAIEIAARRLQDVVNDNPKEREHWWVTIIDTTGVQKQLFPKR